MDLYLDNVTPYSPLQNNMSFSSAATNGNMALLSGKRNVVNCRLCLTEIHDTNVTLLDGIISDMLEIILPELNLSICQTPSICNGCLDTLKQSYSFKSSCLEVEDKVQDFVNPKKPVLIDLKEVIKKTNDIKQISGNLIVCRTCLGLGEESLYTKLSSYEGDPLQNMVEKCLPEMGLNLTKDPTVCPICLEQLEEQFHFIMQCLDTEAKINYYSEKKCVFKDVDLQNVYLFSICMEESDDFDKHFGANEALGNSHCDRITSLNTEETLVKNNLHADQSMRGIKRETIDADYVDLTADLFTVKMKSKVEKFEPVLENKHTSNHENLNMHFFSAHASSHEVEPTEKVTFQISKDTNGEDIITSQTSRISQHGSDSDSDISITKESDLLTVKKVTAARGGLKKVQLNKSSKNKLKSAYKDEEGEISEEEFNKKRTRTRKCKICSFKTKYGSRMKAHMTVNHSVKVADEEPQKPDQKIFKCRRCPFKTLIESEYKGHKLQHRKEKEQKCPQCGMVFVRSDFLQKHIETHSALKGSNVNTLKRLPEITKRNWSGKQSTNLNMAKPKNMRNMFSFNGQVLKMFKCRLCPYQTRLKSNYEKHGLTHKKTTEIKTHRCKICNFETIQKENFLTHMQSHENEEGSKLMKCFLCSFQPTTEMALKQHVNQVHKSGTG